MKKFRTLFVAIVTIMLSFAVLAGGTFALFTEDHKITNHLQAGTLKIDLYRTHLRYAAVNADGVLEEKDDHGQRIPFSGSQYKPDIHPNLFDIDKDVLLVPTCWYEATLEIVNNSDIKFTSSVDIVFDDEESGKELADQLVLTVMNLDGTGAKSVTVGDIPEEGLPLNAFNDPSVKTFSFIVLIEFKNMENEENNKAQSQDVYFDLVVKATQATVAPEYKPVNNNNN